jgi:hypothetical protein
MLIHLVLEMGSAGRIELQSQLHAGNPNHKLCSQQAQLKSIHTVELLKEGTGCSHVIDPRE